MTPDGSRDQAASVTIGPTRSAESSAAVEAARAALGCVYDPELCLDVVSLGLVYDLCEEGDRVVVEMTLTTLGCPVSESLPVLAKEALEAALGPDRTVEVRVVWDPPWNPSMMSEAAADALGFRRH